MERPELQDYVITEPIGAGGLAVIYKANPRLGGLPVVVKVLRPHAQDNEEAVRRFKTEAELGLRLDHPRVVRSLSTGEDPSGRSYVVLELVHGKDLGQVLREAKRQDFHIPSEHFLFLARECLDGLDYLHRLQDPTGKPLHLVHRDLKPPNLMVGFDGHLTILDFSVARVRLNSFQTHAGNLLGTPRYMSPEQILSDQRLDHRSDLYTLALVLYEALAGESLVSTLDDSDLVDAILNKRPRSLRLRCPELADIDGFFEVALAKRPEHRFASAQDMAFALANLATDLPPSGPQAWVKLMQQLFGQKPEAPRRAQPKIALHEDAPTAPPDRRPRTTDDLALPDHGFDPQFEHAFGSDPDPTLNESISPMLAEAPTQNPGLPSPQSPKLAEIQAAQAAQAAQAQAAQAAHAQAVQVEAPSKRPLGEAVPESTISPPRSPDAAELSPVIPGYVMLKHLALGGMASVWLAMRAGEGRPLVVKLLLPHYHRNEAVERRFTREAKIMSLIHHPNVAQVIDAGHDANGRFYLAMEFVAGLDLEVMLFDSMRYREPMPFEVSMAVIRHALTGVHQAHTQSDPQTQRPAGIVHRDLSGRNIMVSFEGDVKVIDFGLARLRASNPNHTRPGVVLGTPRYLSPEQALGDPKLDHRSDQYSLAVLLWECLTARPLIQSGETKNATKEILQLEPEPPSQWNPEVPKRVDAVVMKALSKHPDQRYPDAEAMRRALEEAAPELCPDDALTKAARYARDFAPEVYEEAKACLEEAARSGPPEADATQLGPNFLLAPDAPKSQPTNEALGLRQASVLPSIHAKHALGPTSGDIPKSPPTRPFLLAQAQARPATPAKAERKPYPSARWTGAWLMLASSLLLLFAALWFKPEAPEASDRPEAPTAQQIPEGSAR